MNITKAQMKELFEMFGINQNMEEVWQELEYMNGNRIKFLVTIEGENGPEKQERRGYYINEHFVFEKEARKSDMPYRLTHSPSGLYVRNYRTKKQCIEQANALLPIFDRNNITDMETFESIPSEDTEAVKNIIMEM